MKSNPLKVTFTLKQHTPMIHFQWDQSGSILRASELKPKLDKYLLSLNIKEIEEIVLDYKIKIITNGKIFVEPIQRQETYFNKDIQKIEGKSKRGFPVLSTIPCFFGTMGKDWKINKKELVYTDSDISIEFTIKNPILKKTIQDHFAKFIFHTNFGMRQSKGFGSFSVKDLSFDEYTYATFDIDLNDEIIKKYRPKIVPLNAQDSYDSFKKTYPIFNAVNYLHKALRGGHNTVNSKGETQFYFKSLMYRYVKMKFKDFNWDKKGIKREFLSELDFNKQPNDDVSETNQSRLFRDLLGLSTQFEFRRNDKYPSYGFSVRHPKTSKDSLDRLHNELIQPNPAYRFKSPVLYKIIQTGSDTYKVYIIPNSVDPWMLGKEFKFLKVIKKTIDNQEKSVIVKKTIISTPDEFDITDFLDESLKKKAFDDSVDRKYDRHNDYQLGEYLFSQFT